MAEQRVSGLCAALAAATVAACLAGPPADAKPKTGATPKLDRGCGLLARSTAPSDSRGGDPAPTRWRRSPYLRPRGTLRTTMIFVDFSDAPAAGLATRDVRSLLVRQARRWVAEASYRKAKLAVAGHHRWIRMPKPSSAYWPPGGAYRPDQYIRDAIAAANPQVPFGNAEIVYIVPAPGSQIVLSPAYLAPRIAADGTVLRRFLTFGQDIYGSLPTAAPSRMVQGTAHLLSLPYLDDPSQAAAAGHRWAGAWDPMGEPQLLAHPSAWSKRKLGWLKPGRSLRCIRRGRLSAKLSALSRRRGLRAISVRLSKHRRYVIEARRRRGFDRALCGEGVLVWLIDGSRGSGFGPMRVQPARQDSDNPGRACRHGGVTGALDRAAYEPGQAFRDRKRGVLVEVKRRTRSGFKVSVRRR